MSYWSPELGSGICWTPDDVKIVHFGSPVEDKVVYVWAKPEKEPWWKR